MTHRLHHDPRLTRRNRRATIVVACVAFALGAASLGRSQTGPSYVPARGFVPDSATAVAVAEAILVPIYGRGNIEHERPFHATLRNGVWTVSGSLPKQMLGGVAEVELSQRDARILHVIHGL